MLPGPFRLLSNEEFRSLTLDERVVYLRQAMEALKIIHDQLEEGLSKMIDKDRLDKY